MERQPTNGVLEDFRMDFLEWWQRLPYLVAFLGLFLVGHWLRERAPLTPIPPATKTPCPGENG